MDVLIEERSRIVETSCGLCTLPDLHAEGIESKTLCYINEQKSLLFDRQVLWDCKLFLLIHLLLCSLLFTLSVPDSLNTHLVRLLFL